MPDLATELAHLARADAQIATAHEIVDETHEGLRAFRANEEAHAQALRRLQAMRKALEAFEKRRLSILEIIEGLREAGTNRSHELR